MGNEGRRSVRADSLNDGRPVLFSWLIRCLNEHIAREANRGDRCGGRFWEGRFKSQALLDERALAACLAYVDLNPIRARMAETPEESAHTSIKRRIESARNGQQPATLFPLVGNPRETMPDGIPFPLQGYLELVDWSGRILRDSKRGAIADELPPILERLQIDPQHWLYLNKNFESRFKTLVGSAHEIRRAIRNRQYLKLGKFVEHYCKTLCLGQ